MPRVSAGGLGKCFDFVERQVGSLHFFRLVTFNATEGIDSDDALLEGVVDTGPQFVEVGLLGILGEGTEELRAFQTGRILAPGLTRLLVMVFLHVVEIVLETLNPLRRDVAEGGVWVSIGFEMLQAAVPVAPVALR